MPTNTNPCHTHAITTATLPDGVAVRIGSRCTHQVALEDAYRKIFQLKQHLEWRREAVDALTGESQDLKAETEALRDELAERDKTLARRADENDALRAQIAMLQRRGDEMRETAEEYQISRTIERGQRLRAAIAAWLSVPENSPMGDSDSRPSIIEGIDALRAAGGDAWDKVEDVERELGRHSRRCDADDLATTAVDMDVARRHGRVCRLAKAAQRVLDNAREAGFVRGHTIVIAIDGDPIEDLGSALAEFDADELGQIPPETKADRMISELRGIVRRQAKELEEAKAVAAERQDKAQRLIDKGAKVVQTGYTLLNRLDKISKGRILSDKTNSAVEGHRNALAEWC